MKKKKPVQANMSAILRSIVGVIKRKQKETEPVSTNFSYHFTITFIQSRIYS